MSNLKFVSSVIFVKNIQASKEFYTKIAEQNILYDFGKNVVFKSGFSIWEIDKNHEICRNMVKKPAGNKFELYFETNNLKKFISLIEANKIKKLHNVKEESWGQRTIRIYDPDDHILEIGETMEKFVGRLKKTMSFEEVSEKTGLPIVEIKKMVLNTLLSHHNIT